MTPTGRGGSATKGLPAEIAPPLTRGPSSPVECNRSLLCSFLPLHAHQLPPRPLPSLPPMASHRSSPSLVSVLGVLSVL